MDTNSKQRLLLVAIVMAITTAIFFLGKNNPTALVGDAKNGKTNVANGSRRAATGENVKATRKGNLEAIRQQAMNQLAPTAKDSLMAFRKQGDLRSLARFWQQREYFPLAGAYYLQLARKDSTLANWRLAANTLFKAEKGVQDSATFHYMLDKAQAALKTVVKMAPDDVDAKADLAVTYVDQQQVMKGVGLLKEVLAADPNNQKALFYLGALSLQSNQLEKALERFEKLVDLQPQNPFNYYYLGQVYLRKQDRERAISAFTKYRDRLNDPKLKQQAQETINQLQKN